MSPTNILGAASTTAGSWTLANVGAVTASPALPPALTMDAAGDGVGVVVPSANALSYTTWHAGVWSSPAAIGSSATSSSSSSGSASSASSSSSSSGSPPNLTVRSPPAIDANNGSTAHVVYQDESYKYWYVAYSGSWSTPAPVGLAGSQDFGPFGAGIAALGSNASIAFFDGLGGDAGADLNYAATTDSISGFWQPTFDHAGSTVVGENNPAYTEPPAIVPLGGTDVLLLWVDNTNVINFARRTLGTWGPSAQIAGASTFSNLAVAALPNGEAILAYRGTDSKFYWSLYTSGSWSPVAPFSTTNITIDVSPAVTHGIGGNVAEVAYVTAGVAYHASLSSSSTWSTGIAVGGQNLIGVALASSP